MLPENEEVLKSLRPKLYEMIIKRQEDYKKPFESVELTQARDGSSVLSVSAGGQTLRLNSAFRPQQEAQRWIKQYPLNHLQNIAVMFGFGNGIFVREVLHKIGGDDSLVVLEPCLQIFLAVLDKVDISDILADSRVQVVPDELDGLAFGFALEECLDWKNAKGVCECVHPEYLNLFPEEYKEFIRTAQGRIDLVCVNKSTESHFADMRTRCILRNMRHVRKASILAQCQKLFPKDLPAIIVAAGPSLEKNKQFLKQAEGKAFVFVVDSAVNVIVDSGIPFDAMISVDSGKLLGRINREECKQIPLFCNYESQAGIMRFHEGKKIIIRPADYVTPILAEEGCEIEDINLGGCVANAAFSICQRIGFKRIILVGQDLAYDGEITHAGGEIKNIVNEEVGLREVDGALGGMVRSRYDWLIYLDWFETVIKQMPDVEVIDATEGGALIRGTKVMPLQEAIERYCQTEFDARGALANLPPAIKPEDYGKVHEKLAHFQKEIENIGRYAADAVICCDEALREIEQLGEAPSAYKLSRKLDQLNQKMLAQPIYGLLEFYATGDIADEVQDVNQVTGDRQEDQKVSFEIARATYAAFAAAPKKLAVCIGNTNNDLARVLEEIETEKQEQNGD